MTRVFFVLLSLALVEDARSQAPATLPQVALSERSILPHAEQDSVALRRLAERHRLSIAKGGLFPLAGNYWCGRRGTEQTYLVLEDSSLFLPDAVASLAHVRDPDVVGHLRCDQLEPQSFDALQRELLDAAGLRSFDDASLGLTQQEDAYSSILDSSNAGLAALAKCSRSWTFDKQIENVTRSVVVVLAQSDSIVRFAAIRIMETL